MLWLPATVKSTYTGYWLRLPNTANGYGFGYGYKLRLPATDTCCGYRFHLPVTIYFPFLFSFIIIFTIYWLDLRLHFHLQL